MYFLVLYTNIHTAATAGTSYKSHWYWKNTLPQEPQTAGYMDIFGLLPGFQMWQTILCNFERCDRSVHKIKSFIQPGENKSMIFQTNTYTKIFDTFPSYCSKQHQDI